MRAWRRSEVRQMRVTLVECLAMLGISARPVRRKFARSERSVASFSRAGPASTLPRPRQRYFPPSSSRLVLIGF